MPELSHKVDYVEPRRAFYDQIAFEAIDADRGEICDLSAWGKTAERTALSPYAPNFADNRIAVGELLDDVVFHVREGRAEGSNPVPDTLWTAQIELRPVEVGSEDLVRELKSVVCNDLLEQQRSAFFSSRGQIEGSFIQGQSLLGVVGVGGDGGVRFEWSIHRICDGVP